MPGGSDVEVRASLRDDLSGPLDNVRREVRRTAADVDDAGKRAGRGARGFESMAAGVGRLAKSAGGLALKGAAIGVGALAAAAAVGSVKLVQLAMDAAETASKFRTVFAGVPGEVGKYLDDLSSRYGLVTKDLQDAAANFGVFGKAAGIPKDALGAFSKDLVGAGTDLASFYNADPTEVFQALRSGLSGEAEPLRQFGIFLSDATLKSKAATMGLTGTLTESQKVMVRQRIIMESLGDAQGDLERTSGGLSNQWKALKGRLENAGTAIGTALLPSVTMLVTGLNNRLGPAVDQLEAKLPGLTAQFGTVVTAFQAGGLDSGVAQIDRLTGSGGKLTDALNIIRPIVDDVATVVRDVLAPAIVDVSTAITPGWLTPLGAARAALGLMADHTTTARIALVSLVAVVAAAKVATMLKTAADIVSLTWLKAHTIGTKTHTAVSIVASAATKAWAATQWLLNAALTANPIGLVLVAIGLLVAGLVLAWRHSETFRSIVIAVFREVSQTVLDVVDTLLSSVQGAFEVLGKLPGPLGAPFRTAAAAVQTARDKVNGLKSELDTLGQKQANPTVRLSGVGAFEQDLLRLERRITNIGGVQVAIPARSVGGGVPSGRAGGPFADTATSRASGGGGLAATMGAHASISAASGSSPRITNALTGGGGHGWGSGDHQAGNALDLTGQGLSRYRQETRRRGGYAEYHGSGRSRHLHAVPAKTGDTRTSMVRRSSGTSGGGTAIVTPTRVVIGPGAIIVQGLTAEQAGDAVAAGIETYVRERQERS